MVNTGLLLLLVSYLAGFCCDILTFQIAKHIRDGQELLFNYGEQYWHCIA